METVTAYPTPGLSAAAVPFQPAQAEAHPLGGPHQPHPLGYDPVTAHRDFFILTQLRDAILAGIHPHYPRPAQLGPPPPPPAPPPGAYYAEAFMHAHALPAADSGAPAATRVNTYGTAGAAPVAVAGPSQTVAVGMRKAERGAKRAKRRGKADWDGQDDVIGSLDYGETAKAVPSAGYVGVQHVPAGPASPGKPTPPPAVAPPAKAEHSHSRSSRKQPPVGSAPPFALRDVPIPSEPPLFPTPGSQSPASPVPVQAPAGEGDAPPARKETRGERKDREAREVQAKRAAAKAAKEAEAAGGGESATHFSNPSTVDLGALPVDSRARSRATKPSASVTSATVSSVTAPASTSAPAPSPVSSTRPLPAPYADPVAAAPPRANGRGAAPPQGRMDGDFGYVAVPPEGAEFSAGGAKGKKGKAGKSKALGKMSPRIAGAPLPLPLPMPPSNATAPPPTPPGMAGAYDPQQAGYVAHLVGHVPQAYGYDPRFPVPAVPGQGYGYGPPPVGDPYGYERGAKQLPSLGFVSQEHEKSEPS